MRFAQLEPALHAACMVSTNLMHAICLDLMYVSCVIDPCDCNDPASPLLGFWQTQYNHKSTTIKLCQWMHAEPMQMNVYQRVLAFNAAACSC